MRIVLLYTLTHTSEYNNIIRVNDTYVTYVCVCEFNPNAIRTIE